MTAPIAKVSQGDIDRTYLLFLLCQCDGCDAALVRAFALADHRLDHGNLQAQVQAFNDFQTAFAFAAIIGKILWPGASNQNPQIAIPRGERLRKLLGVTADSLLQNWRIRNHFEHLDERIDEWSKQPKRSVLYHFGSPVKGVSRNETFNRYDFDTETFHMLNQSVNVGHLHRHVLAIREATSKAIEAISPGSWTPRPLQ